MAAALWLSNLDNAGSETGAGPVGPSVRHGMLLLGIGRMVILGLLKAALTMMAIPWVET